jgi:hypothetical protein
MSRVVSKTVEQLFCRRRARTDWGDPLFSTELLEITTEKWFHINSGSYSVRWRDEREFPATWPNVPVLCISQIVA